jgi:hypothetical protein
MWMPARVGGCDWPVSGHEWPMSTVRAAISLTASKLLFLMLGVYRTGQRPESVKAGLWVRRM